MQGDDEGTIYLTTGSHCGGEPDLVRTFVNYRGTKIMESVGRDIVIKLGVFGELHNFKVLVEYYSIY